MRLLTGMSVAVACALALGGAGCSGGGADAGAQAQTAVADVPRAPSAAAPESAASSTTTRATQPGPARGALVAPGQGVPRMLIMAAPPGKPALSPEEGPPEPTAEYPSLEAVRDTLLAMVRRATAGGDTAVHVSSGTTQFQYHFVEGSAAGYAIHVVVTDTTSCPVEYVEKALEVAGWAPKYDYSADGPDGTTMGYVTRKYFCFLEGRWDGGDDTDTTYVPAPGCEVTITCVPRREDDVMK